MLKWNNCHIEFDAEVFDASVALGLFSVYGEKNFLIKTIAENKEQRMIERKLYTNAYGWEIFGVHTQTKISVRIMLYSAACTIFWTLASCFFKYYSTCGKVHNPV